MTTTKKYLEELGYVSYMLIIIIKKKRITIKHRDNIFYLNHTQNSFYQILKYPANAKINFSDTKFLS